MNRTVALIDIKNTFFALAKHHERKTLNYEKLHALISGLGDLRCAKAYGLQVKDEAMPFITKLKHIGFEVHYKQARFVSSDWNCGMTVDAMTMADRMDTLVLVTSDNDLLPLMQHMRSRGVEVIVIGVKLSRAIQEVAKIIEITDDMLEAPKNHETAKSE